MWFNNPFWLFLLLLIFPLIILGNKDELLKIINNFINKKNNNYKQINKVFLLLIFRILIIVFTVLAIAEINILLPSQNQNVVFLIDISDSIGREQIEKVRRASIEQINKLNKNDRISIITFAGTPEIQTSMSTPDNALKLLETIQLISSKPGQTDLNAALRLADELISDINGIRYIILFSDGRSTAGDPVSFFSKSINSIPVYTIPVGLVNNGIISKNLIIPEIVHPDENILVEWQVVSDTDQSVKIKIIIDDKIQNQENVKILKGDNNIPLRITGGSSGFHTLEIQAISDNGQFINQAVIKGLLNVKGPAKVLVINGNAGYSPLADSLKIQKILVDEKKIDGLPDNTLGYAGYSSVILDNVYALQLTEKQLDGLENFILGGGGALVIGGDKSLGKGEYYDTTLEKILPVETDLRRRLFYNNTNILFIIDHSGSMSLKVGNISKQLACMNAIADSLNELSPEDEVAVLTFSSKPSWILHFTKVEYREEILKALSNLPKGGGTDLGKVFEELTKSYYKQGPKMRHVIILSDGLTNNANFKEMTKKLTSLGVTFTTIGIGDEINEILLKDIAEWGNGKFYRAELDQISTVIVKETIRATRELIQEGNFKLLIKNYSPILEGFENSIPPISGYIITKPKNMTTVYFEVINKEDPNKRDPILVSWRYGNGNVMVFTSDSGKRWMHNWSSNPLYNRLWSQIIRNIEKGSIDLGLKATVQAESEYAHITVEAIGPDRKSRSGLQLIGRPLDNIQSYFSFKETFPGLYEAYSLLNNSGLQQFEIYDKQNNSWTLGWAWNPSGSELIKIGPDLNFLSNLSLASNGKIQSLQTISLPKSKWAWKTVSLQNFLIALAVLFLIIELFLRSASFGQLNMLRAQVSAWWESQKKLIEIIKKDKT